MSLQAQPQQPVQQVYPATVTNQPPSHHSNGSFGAVFIVLAIILVISTVACFLGRLCNRRYNNNHNHNHNHSRNRNHDDDDYRHHNQSQRPPVKQQQIHNFHPREGDIEFGVDSKRFPPTIPRPKGGLVHHGPAGTGSHPPPHRNGNMKDFEEIVKPDHEGELRAGV